MIFPLSVPSICIAKSRKFLCIQCERRRYRRRAANNEQPFKRFQPFKPFNRCVRSIPHLFPPPRRVGGLRRGLERLEHFERKLPDKEPDFGYRLNYGGSAHLAE